jgi:ABC-2 type transport system permease protein
MITIGRYALRRLRGQIIGWGLALAVFAVIVALLYDAVVQMRDQLEQLLKSLPSEFTVFIGSLDSAFSPAGYLGVRYFMFMPLIVGVFAVIIGSGLIVGDEENGTLDLILAQPVRRAAFYLGRWLALVIALAGILLIAWLGLCIGIGLSSLAIDGLAALRPFLSLFAVMLWYGGLALLLSLLLPSRRWAASLSGLILVADFFITTLASISPDLKTLAAWSPLTAYQGGEAIKFFDVNAFWGLCLVSIGFAAIGLWLFQRRDIRVAGEGGWRALKLHLKR